MSQSPLFSSGSELGNLAVTSGVLSDSWDVNSALYREINNAPSSDSVRFKIDERPNCNIIAFVTWPPCTKEHLQAVGAADFVSSSALKDTLPLFEFLCSKTNPCFSINKLAVECFKSLRGALPFLRSKISDAKPLIITGHGLGGSVASLFTLWLLSEINLSKTKRPLCVTFGSPLIGDEDLKEAILQYSAWNSCFLHVVSAQDPLPRVLTSTHNPPSTESASRTKEYEPFGTFMLCSELGFTCFEDPEFILEFLKATYTEVSPQFLDYKPVVDQLKLKVICKDTSRLDVSISQPLRAGITVQVLATGLGQQQPWQNIDINPLITKAEKGELQLMMQKTRVFDPSKELNDMKINMAQLEWYKKTSKDSGIGYYDSYKNQSFTSDQDVERYKKILTWYWDKLVDEVDKKPQKEGASFRTRWLFGGTNYRRMIEPLEIAAFYRDGHTDYFKGRPKHFELLEQWLNNDGRPASNPNINSKKKNVEASLTEDSCFWAHVEQARISCKFLIPNSGLSIVEGPHKSNLIEFEAYVLGLLRNYAVSPEIFLSKSSFMGWWREYEKIIVEGIMGTFYRSPLTQLMKTRQYSQYATGSLPEYCMQ